MSASNVSSVTSHFSVASEGFIQTTNGSILSGAATIPMNSMSGLTNGNVFVGIIEAGVVGKEQTFTGIVDTSGSQFTGVVWTRGSNTAHAGGVSVVDYVTGTGHNMMTKGILVAHEQTGVHKAGMVLPTPKVTTSLNDANGNEVIKTPATASAVNEVTITNAATTVAPKISATGDDTNIDLWILAKGTGSPRFAGVYDGWVAANETITYASATTFTCSAALAATLGTGDRFKLSQTTVKYFYVVSVSGTTVTITGGTDYTLANAAITLPFYSHEENPTGFPQVFAYAGPLTTNVPVNKGSTGTEAYTFSMHGKHVTVKGFLFANGSGIDFGSGGSAFSIPLPVTISAAADAKYRAPQPLGTWYGDDNGTSTWFGPVTTAQLLAQLVTLQTVLAMSELCRGLTPSLSRQMH